MNNPPKKIILIGDGNNATTSNIVKQEQQVNQTVELYFGLLLINKLGSLELHEFLGDQHSSAVQRLIVATIVIVLISAMLVATVILFRCYMLYCQDHLNIRHYQRPPIEEELKGEGSKCEEKGLFNPIKKTTTTFENLEKNLLKNENGGVKRYYNNNNKCISSKYSFKNIFDDDD
uniref:Uncharacterized protein n=1 Tax=Meloidogyne javanica TaxID=6303 RepID=A0A915LN42_MELJA